MAVSDTEIANRALVRVGAARIQDINNIQDSKTATVATLYPEARDALLRRCRWNFARRFASLNQLAAAPLGLALMPDPEYAGDVVYTGAYALPNDYLRLSDVSPRDAHWRVVGQALYTDAPAPASTAVLIGLQPPGADGADNMPAQGSTGSVVPNGIEYIAQITDPNQFDPLFSRCLSLQLAYELTFSVNASESLRQALRQEWKEAFDEARAIAGMEQWPEQLFNTVMVDVRYGYANSAGAGSGLFA